MRFERQLRRYAAAIVLGCGWLSIAALPVHAGGVEGKLNAAAIAAGAAAPAMPAHLMPPVAGPGTDPEAAITYNRAASEAAAAGGTSPPISTPTGPYFYPAVITQSSPSGPVITSATQHNIYIGCSAKNAQNTCWGSPDPSVFENNYNDSTMIKLLNQYVGSSKTKRYSVDGTWYYFSGTPSGNYVSFTSLMSYLAGAFSGLGSHGGMGHFYHLFLASGIDTCQSNGTSCYSPDGKHGTFAFCAYHSYTTINKQLVFYTVEPYQAVNGCYGTGTAVHEATANVLSHETSELITDPEINAWLNHTRAFGGNELADECVWELYDVNLNGTTYLMQLEYSNTYQACASIP